MRAGEGNAELVETRVRLGFLRVSRSLIDFRLIIKFSKPLGGLERWIPVGKAKEGKGKEEALRSSGSLEAWRFINQSIPSSSKDTVQSHDPWSTSWEHVLALLRVVGHIAGQGPIWRVTAEPTESRTTIYKTRNSEHPEIVKTKGLCR